MIKLIGNRIWTVIIVVSWIVLLINVNLIAITEGMINPVVNEVYIEKVSEDLVYGSVNKLRSCELVGMEWYIKTNSGDYEKINTNFDSEEINVLGKGKHIVGPMKLDIDEEDIKDSRIRTYHKCEDGYTLTKNTITISKVNS